MLVGLLTMRIENFGKLCMEVVETSVHQLTPGHLTLRQIPHFGAYLKFLKVILVPFFSLITVGCWFLSVTSGSPSAGTPLSP